MRTVAVAAAHQTEAHGMRRGLLEIGALLLVAVEAHVGLVGLGQHGVALGVQLVAIGAGQGAALVRAGVPAGARAVLVAIEAGCVALGDRQEGIRLEAVDRLLLVAALAGMATAGTVARLALQSTSAERRVLVAAVCMRGLEDGRGGVGGGIGVFVVATEAGVGT